MELKPCPGCEGEAVPVIDMDYGGSYAECQSCGFTAPIDNWNTRPVEDALQKRIEELEVTDRDWDYLHSAWMEDRDELIAALDRADRAEETARVLAERIKELEERLSDDEIVSILDGNAKFLDKRHAECDAIEDENVKLKKRIEELEPEWKEALRRNAKNVVELLKAKKKIRELESRLTLHSSPDEYELYPGWD